MGGMRSLVLETKTEKVHGLLNLISKRSLSVWSLVPKTFLKGPWSEKPKTKRSLVPTTKMAKVPKVPKSPFRAPLQALHIYLH